MRAAPWGVSGACWALWGALAAPRGPAEWALGLPVAVSAWWLYDRVLAPARPLPASRAAGLAWAVGRYALVRVLPEMASSTWRVFARALAPHPRFAPAIVAVPLPGATPAGLLLLAYGISLTPGQQLLAIDEPAGTIYVHVQDAPDPAAVVAEIQATYRRYIEEATRW